LVVAVPVLAGVVGAGVVVAVARVAVAVAVDVGEVEQLAAGGAGHVGLVVAVAEVVISTGQAIDITVLVPQSVIAVGVDCIRGLAGFTVIIIVNADKAGQRVIEAGVDIGYVIVAIVAGFIVAIPVLAVVIFVGIGKAVSGIAVTVFVIIGEIIQVTHWYYLLCYLRQCKPT
ncbi:hypothetical protein E0E54_09715, partial [Azotobacter chroococcum]